MWKLGAHHMHNPQEPHFSHPLYIALLHDLVSTTVDRCPRFHPSIHPFVHPRIRPSKQDPHESPKQGQRRDQSRAGTLCSERATHIRTFSKFSRPPPPSSLSSPPNTCSHLSLVTSLIKGEKFSCQGARAIMNDKISAPWCLEMEPLSKVS